MKFSKRIVAAMLCLFMVITGANVISAKTLTGDLESDPITIQQKQQKNFSITKNGHSKYFKVIVKDTGKLTIKFASDSLKKAGTLSLIYDDNGVYYDQVNIRYNKNSKIAKASLTTTRIVAPGQYCIVVNTETVSKKTPFSLTTTLKEYKCNDEEPNEKEESAQKIVLNSGKKAITYTMLLSGETFEQDLIDQFQFKLNKAKKIKITATAKGTGRIRILLKKKTADGSDVINTDTTKQYFVSDKGKNVFSYTTDKALTKGTYYIMVWLEDTQKIQVPYTIKAEIVK
mgnify:FL=1